MLRFSTTQFGDIIKLIQIVSPNKYNKQKIVNKKTSLTKDKINNLKKYMFLTEFQRKIGLTKQGTTKKRIFDQIDEFSREFRFFAKSRSF